MGKRFRQVERPDSPRRAPSATERHAPSGVRPANKPLRLVRVELVIDEDPDGIRIGVDGLADVPHVILLGSCWPNRRRDGQAGRHVEVRDEAERPVALRTAPDSPVCPWMSASTGFCVAGDPPF